MEKIRDVLKKHGFTFKKSLGQNFLTDENLLDSIAEAAGIGKSDTVVEIGCGAGTLTRALSKLAGRVRFAPGSTGRSRHHARYIGW